MRRPPSNGWRCASFKEATTCRPKKLATRFDRTLENLHRAIRELRFVQIFDNSDLRHPFRKVAEFENGNAIAVFKPVPAWLKLGAH